MDAVKKRIMVYVAAGLILVLLAGGVIAAALNRAAPVSVGELLSLGEKYLLDLDYEQALAQFLKVIEIEPMNPRGYTESAAAYVGLDQTDKAIEILEAGLLVLHDSDVIRTRLDDLRSPEIDNDSEPMSVETESSSRKIGEDGLVIAGYFSCSNISYSFEWGVDSWLAQRDNEVLGECNIKFRIASDTLEIADVRIASGTSEPSWSDDKIERTAEWVIPVWKETWESYPFYGDVSNGFPIGPNDLGTTHLTLLFVLDENCELIGHIIVPVQIPATATYPERVESTTTQNTVINDMVFEFDGIFAEFMDVWIDGMQLVRGIDYDAHTENTGIIITVHAQTLGQLDSGTHTIAAEFRENGALVGEIRREAQNFTIPA